MPNAYRLGEPLWRRTLRACELLVDLSDVLVTGIDRDPGQPMRVHVETRVGRPGCPVCGVFARAKDRDVVELVDLPSYGRPRRLVWHKRRWWCADADCTMKTFTEGEPRIAAPRMDMTDRAGRWVTEQVGRWARSINEVATELGCDWHTVNDAVVRYGEALVDEPGRFGDVGALGLDGLSGSRHPPDCGGGVKVIAEKGGVGALPAPARIAHENGIGDEHMIVDLRVPGPGRRVARRRLALRL